METNDRFWNYYLKYLGVVKQELKNKDFVTSCSQREKPLNHWCYQHLILTTIDGKNIFSITPKLYREFNSYISPYKCQSSEELIIVLNEFFTEKINDFITRKMYRLTLEKTKLKSKNHNKVITLTKDILMNSMGNISLEKKEEVWKRKKQEVEQGRQFVILQEGKIVSYCKISNVDYEGGNLTVWTASQYRKKGYGKEVVVRAIRWCFDNNVIPIYWVDSNNAASINLAKSIGFEIKSEELVVSTNENSN